MHPENSYFDVYPKIVPANRRTTITIRPLFDHVHLEEGSEYALSIFPIEGALQEVVTLTLKAEGGALHVPVDFGSEQEYRLRFEIAREGRKNRTVDVRIYALEEDLYLRKPYKGDFHMHTMRSDGVESPAYVAASCRKIGMDFMAITDHYRYEPSLEAIRAFESVETDLRIYPGEEIHPPDNTLHMINFGGRISINALIKDSDTYRREVQSLEESYTDLPAGPLRYQYASCVWCYLKIQAVGGLGIFCHPYWVYQNRHNVPEILVRKLFDEQPFGAFELIGGMHSNEIEWNHLQVARYHEERARGKRIPIVGVSDSHGCETGEMFGWYHTIVFSPSTDLPDLIQSIRGLYSVAVETLPGETPRVHGPFRLVRYAQFLLHEVFPGHDELCREEGKLLLAHAGGNSSAAQALKALKGQCEAHLQHAWGWA